MKQEREVEDLVRQRIRGLRVARGWSLDDLAARSLLSPSTLSRIETGALHDFPDGERAELRCRETCK